MPFSNDFKFTMTAVMVVDYIGCWVVEQALKRLFSDYRPKDIAVRRRDQLEREEERRKEEIRKREMAEEERMRRQVEEVERKMGGAR